MSEPVAPVPKPISDPLPKTTPPAGPKRGRWKRRLKWAAIATLVLCIVAGYLVKDYVRTLYSLRRVPGTNAFVMDYYADYHIDKIRTRGMDVNNIEDEFIDGEIRVTPSQGPWQICTNSIAWNKTQPERASACPRYQIGSDLAAKLGAVVDYPDARKVARSMSVRNWTMWTSIYNLTTREVHVIYRANLDAEYQDAIGP